MFKQYIDAGMALLDENVPGWEDRIDVYKLNMKSNRDCVIGQLFGSFYDIYGMIDYKEVPASDFGFSLPDTEEYENTEYANIAWSYLTSEWVYLILPRVIGNYNQNMTRLKLPEVRTETMS